MVLAQPDSTPDYSNTEGWTDGHGPATAPASTSATSPKRHVVTFFQMNQVSVNEVKKMLELYKKFGSSIIHGLHIHKHEDGCELPRRKWVQYQSESCLCKWSCGQMVDPAMEGLYRAKFLSWFTDAIACCPGSDEARKRLFLCLWRDDR